MKKNLFKVLFGVCLFMVGFNVNAETSTDLPDIPGGEGSTDNTVTVGNVDTPVYNVNIYWNDLTFDWSYDYEEEMFGWKPSSVCTYLGNDADFGADRMLYNDENCTEEAGFLGEEVEDGVGKYYVASRERVFFSIEDYSTFGQIVPSVIWNSATGYDYVDAKFSYDDEQCVLIPNERVFDAALNYGVYSNNQCSVASESTTFEENTYYAIVEHERVLEGTELPDSARRSAAGSIVSVDGYVFVDHAYARNNYYLSVELENNTPPTTTPKAGDEIGTITISIRAK